MSASGEASALVASIGSNTKTFVDYLASQKLPEPSFDKGDGLELGHRLPSDVEAAREAAIEATFTLYSLLVGPMGLVTEAFGEQYLMPALQYIYRNKLQHLVPVNGETTYAKIAEAAGLKTSDVMRFMRCATTRHVFKEPTKGVVVHTAASRILLDNPLMEASILNSADEFLPSLSRLVDATVKWPGSEEPNESGYSLSHNTDENPFDFIKRDPKRNEQFANQMKYSHMAPAYNMEHLLNTYDFGAVGKGGVIVDVGGSRGAVSIAIAEKWPHVTCMVQDIPETVADLPNHVPDALKGRVIGMAHDFLTPQPLRGADLFLFRWIMHDWSDKYCVQILRALVPALKPGSKVLINDICLPEPGQISFRVESQLRKMDLAMKAFNNARERDAETWAWLFETADARFRFKGITIPPHSRMAVIEAEWAGEAAS